MLKRKAMRDIKNNLSSFITIFLMAFLGVLAFSGIHAYMDGMEDSANRYYEKNNLQDLWLMGENFDDDAMKEIRELDGVKNAERALVVNTSLNGFDNVDIEANFIETNEISVMHVVDGESFAPDKKGFWFDSYLAENIGVKVGDEITLTYNDYEITGKILGLVNTPDHVYSIKDESAIFPTHEDYGFAYMSMDMFPQQFMIDEAKKEIARELDIPVTDVTDEVFDMALPEFDPAEHYIFTNVYVDVEDDADLEAVKSDIQNKIKAATAVTDRDANISVAQYKSEVDEGKTYSSVFTLLFLFIAILSVVTTMHRFVKKQRTQIGTLKALGIKRRKIQWHYISYGFFISFIAAALGIVLGRISIGNFFISMEAEMFEMPDMRVKTLPIVYIVACGVVALITFVTYLTCRKVLSEPASEALRLEVPKVKTGEVKPSRGITKKFPVDVRWNLRDIKRNKGRTATGIAGIVGCTMLIVCAFGMRDTMNFFIDWQFEKLYQFGYKLSLESGISDEDLESIYDKYGDATSMTLAIEYTSSDGEKSTQRLVINDSDDLVRYTGHKAQHITISDGGIYVSEKLADNLGLKKGDTVTWTVYGEDKEYKTEIAGTYKEPQGQSFGMTRAYAKELGIDYNPDAVYTNADLSGVKSIPGVSIIQNKAELKTGTLSMIGMVNKMVVLLIIVSVILAVVIIYNLGILSFSEKQYQFATMKVLGFRAKKIKKIYVMQNIWIGIAAIILGMPFGYMMTVLIYKMAIGDNFDMLVHINPVTYIVGAVGTFIVTYIVNMMLARKVKTIDMVTSLKANE
ncbi:MAG: ABC transporter permease [Clostridium sp.]|nr:ABC transporter permease [Clostridium sp.]MCM1172279.1 ABC transporter permease [Clostridium sp.]MCM1208702.1 ABC transporter permease [Ruminococcus sp.]